MPPERKQRVSNSRQRLTAYEKNKTGTAGYQKTEGQRSMEVKGKITAVIGAVVDAVFEGRVPRVHEAIYVPCPEQERTVWLECALLLPEGAVRCIALHATEGLVRGMAAFATGEPIKVRWARARWGAP